MRGSPMPQFATTEFATTAFTTALAPLPVRFTRPEPARSEPPPPLPPSSRRAADTPDAHAGPSEKPLRGLRLVLVWLGMLAVSWAAALALGYGIYAVLRALAA